MKVKQLNNGKNNNSVVNAMKKAAPINRKCLDQKGFNSYINDLAKESDKAVKNKTILDEAKELIYSDRNNSYGTVTENFTRIAAGWAQIVGVPVTAEMVGLMMAWLKISRQVFKPSKDNLLDCIGYIACLEKLSKGE